MNESRFNFFFTYFVDLHNLNIEKRLQIVANPFHEEQYKNINIVKKQNYK